MKIRKHFIFTVSEKTVNRVHGGYDQTVTVLEIKSKGKLRLVDSVVHNSLVSRGAYGCVWEVIKGIDKNVEAFCKRTGFNPELYPTESEGKSILVEQV